MNSNTTKLLLYMNNLIFGFTIPIHISLVFAFFNLLGEGKAPTVDRHDITYVPGFIYLFIFIWIIVIYILINILLLRKLKERKKKIFISLSFLISGVLLVTSLPFLSKVMV